MSDSPPHIFLSHAAADKELADKLTDLLQTGCNLSADQIFCTSLEGMGIPAGKSFPDFIREKIKNPALVIALITPSYLASEFCLCELGATWAMEHEFFPLIVPPAKRDKMKGVLTGIQIEKVDDSSGLDNLRDAIKRVMNRELPTARWTAKRDGFLVALSPILQQLTIPNMVDREELKLEQDKYQAAMEEIADREQKVRELKEMCEQLKACKDAEEVQEILSTSSTALEKFQVMVEEVKKALKPIPCPTCEALYQENAGRNLTVKRFSDFEPDDITPDVEGKYLVESGFGHLVANEDHPKVARAKKGISDLSTFLEESEADPVLDHMSDKYDFPIDLSNRDFWNALFQ
ncbi:MAG: TIR domain-containing protein [Verrucomicrobia bacterium]|nr:TIR domain-containing protein [Verrucomicrobiota bacterium]MCH8511655.1 TIR domain-containing protein [Kiritimatiellia bacterium]